MAVTLAQSAASLQCNREREDSFQYVYNTLLQSYVNDILNIKKDFRIDVYNIRIIDVYNNT